MSTNVWLCIVSLACAVCFVVGLFINTRDAEKSDKQIAEEQVAGLRRSVVVKLRELARRVEDPNDDLWTN